MAGPHLIQIGEVCTRLRILDISYTNWRAIPVRKRPLPHTLQLPATLTTPYSPTCGVATAQAASLMPVARNCPRLEILNVASSKKLTDTVITAIGSNSPGLRYNWRTTFSNGLGLTNCE